MKHLGLLLSFFKPHMKMFMIDLCCAIMVAVVDLAFPLISRYAMYNLLPDQKYRIFFILMISVGLFYLLRYACYYLMFYVGHTFGVHVEADIRSALLRTCRPWTLSSLTKT